MMGTRAMSGSAASSFQEGDHGSLRESSMPSSMLMSMIWAPLIDLLSRHLQGGFDSRLPGSGARSGRTR